MGSGWGWESVRSFPLDPGRHPEVEVALAPKESYPRVPTIQELRVTSDPGQVILFRRCSGLYLYTRRMGCSLGSRTHHSKGQDGRRDSECTGSWKGGRRLT